MTETIERATPADVEAVRALLEHNGLPVGAVTERIPATLVVRNAGQVVGSAALELYGCAALLRSVVVDAGGRGRGLGQRLIVAALERARQEHVCEVYLLTETAHEFFPRFGFRIVERAEVAPALQQSDEWTCACPASAKVMMLRLEGCKDEG